MRTATYGTGEMPEMAVFREMTGGLLSRDEEPPIRYQPRPPLVRPPTTAALPPPADSAETATADWPLDPDQAAGGPVDLAGDDPRAGGSQAEYRRLRPLAGLFPQQAPRTDTNDENMYDEAYDIVGDRQQRQQFEQALAESKGYARTERRYLTDPPMTYREPAATAPIESAEVKKKKGFFLTRWLTGGG
jgi:hypothetical protein